MIKKENPIQTLSHLRTNARALVYFFGALMFCVLVAFTVYRLFYEYEQEQSNADREGRNIAAAFEMHVRNSLQDAEYQATNIRTLYETQKNQEAAIKSYMELARTMSGVLDLQITDEAGAVIATASRAQKAPSIAAKDYFLHHLENRGKQGFVGKTFRDGTMQPDGIPVSWRLNKPDGTFGGVVVVLLIADKITDFFSQMELGHDKITTLVGLDGIVRARQNMEDRRNGQNISASPLIANAKQQLSGSFSSFSLIDRTERMQCFRVIPEYAMIVSIGISTEGIFRNYTERKRTYVGTAVLTSLVIGVFCFALLRTISKQRSLQDRLEEANEELADTNRKLAVANVHLESIASLDSLTGAWNRRSFERSADLEINRARRYQYSLSLMMIDIDHFKKVNDRFGHPVGDTVLIRLVELLQHACRETDFLARLGGEEFVMVVPHAGAPEAVALAERIRQRVSSHDFPQVGSVTVSIGVAEYNPGESLECVVGRADKALYAAKASGRNRVRLDEGGALQS